ncbi:MULTISPECIES: poly-beta-1,6-N-acetyl-D-glucosamine biosynthesis protein PgaD [Acinetobacter]|uniref:poly-beta-1,6-N-acetyl-D-glucosamine biosynthesis protein PgaD n=1 Tax=Acinetobacter TaxID=469 RepID=UPI001F232002|nr:MULTISPECIES: poly-beta-1,6-N-acetyl-D-glucosamine biosynthesis protein PgaD [Acinetobacter]MDV2453777.1 poly-beta-1,6-N-acetyl-D-glucosamine biosynthesis protein PgaD [Acinetobacter towneri]UIZ58279.1 poly-beta-1,6-N-acetyl-D-glucosamine biosynthesis protein PgaD [Acinetobacter sp. SCLZS86]WOE28124.1 poly-beta-1,6-N-acetyl-D-glucosamine biosynthesis protein PgaD [Acinetobacter towneri]
MPKYEMIQDESQLEIPQYIDEPKYVRNKSAGYGLFFLGWLVWIWLFLPLITLLLWWYEGYTVYHHLIIGNGPDGPISLLHMALAIDIFILFLLVWASYNWIRFRNKERRHAPVPVGVEQMAESFNLPVADVESMKQAKNITLHYDEDGVLQQYAINQTLPVASVATGLNQVQPQAEN